MTQDAARSKPSPMERLPTHVPGLDLVLDGGLVRGGVYLLGGRPGTGKTTLGNQLAHEHARSGGNVLFATLRDLTTLTSSDLLALF